MRGVLRGEVHLAKKRVLINNIQLLIAIAINRQMSASSTLDPLTASNKICLKLTWLTANRYYHTWWTLAWNTRPYTLPDQTFSPVA